MPATPRLPDQIRLQASQFSPTDAAVYNFFR
jgi:hypothetical protein